MKEIFDFLVLHWQLSLAFILCVSAYFMYEFWQREPAATIGPEQAVALINHEQGVVVDVRTREEFESGHILHAINIGVDEPDTAFKKLNKYVQKPVILVCRTGKRSANCVSRLQTQGFARVYTLSGGLESWQESGLPLVK